jgi:hypothetical protein
MRHGRRAWQCGHADRAGRLSGQLFSILTPGALEGLPVLHCARRTGQTGAAGVQAAEFADKANIEPVFAAVTQNAIVVAGRCVLSKQVLNTQSAIARTVGSHLACAVHIAACAVLAGGTAAVGWPFEGVVALANPCQALIGGSSIADAILAGATRMRLQGFAPSIVLSEGDYLGAQLAKSTTGEYLSGRYGEAMALSIAGMRFAVSAGLPVGKALLIDESFVGYLASATTRLTVGTTGSQLIQNAVTASAETVLIPFVADFEALVIATPSTTRRNRESCSALGVPPGQAQAARPKRLRTFLRLPSGQSVAPRRSSTHDLLDYRAAHFGGSLTGLLTRRTCATTAGTCAYRRSIMFFESGLNSIRNST